MLSNDLEMLVVPDSRCEICGTPRDLDRHHIAPRGMGGSKEPKVLGEDNLITLLPDMPPELPRGRLGS